MLANRCTGRKGVLEHQPEVGDKGPFLTLSAGALEVAERLIFLRFSFSRIDVKNGWEEVFRCPIFTSSCLHFSLLDNFTLLVAGECNG